MKRHIFILLAVLISSIASVAEKPVLGAERQDLYLPHLKGKRVALYTNHTGLLPDGTHTLDHLRDLGINVSVIFSPEHGFRGNADAGQHVSGGIDPSTGTPVKSLFGKGKKEALKSVADVDVIVTDIQDVGLRFYTYYCTMLELMNEAAASGKKFMVFDRPNPNIAMGVDGPILEDRYRSGVGRLPIPVLHGLTLGEIALMASGEGWLKGGMKSDLTVIPMKGYTRTTRYELPVAPSPNLPCQHAIYLYPSTCLFEGTILSLGRGTDYPFEVYGHPDMDTAGSEHAITFTPRSRQGASSPPLKGKLCHGIDLRGIPSDSLIAKGFDLSYIIDAYKRMGRPEGFFTNFFELLTGTATIRRQIEAGADASTIRATWQPTLQAFRDRRAPTFYTPNNRPVPDFTPADI